MKVSILTSGFSNGFTDDFVKCLRQYYYNSGSFLFIASDFSGHSKTDRYTEEILNMFRNKGILFNEFQVIDDRITEKKAKQCIENADIIWLSGGDTLKQIAYLKEYKLIPFLQSREGITIGMSAGSINMAKKVVLAKDIDDNIPALSIYDGIGIVDINIEPHLNAANEEHIKDIKEASQYATIYGLYDNSFIMIVDDKIKIFGKCFKYENTVRQIVN
ncbi:Type 1 glutamine amidotransferase-like domain-containing protein [Niallia sp. MER 6]|uniref:Type 1 glutamine amidotransferase-like domain-containing protein n=1 Tax=Niallia sp. MER 6 TaxID=2939567 RepID=UPI00203FC586|nr:Type 1 glutamine amidotransferase-like domain-containing protein [Niallia sp. MER 6]MCM3034301.1 Type 1 glutamine amidotransferase-like domain-containing protein [Niallia sp. MER 6]